MIDPRDPAFPQTEDSACEAYVSQGINIRAYLAAKAMQAILTGTSGNLEMFAKMVAFSAEEGDDTVSGTVAELAVEYADTLIAALNEKGGNA